MRNKEYFAGAGGQLGQLVQEQEFLGEKEHSCQRAIEGAGYSGKNIVLGLLKYIAVFCYLYCTSH